MISILDYGSGNIKAFANVYTRLNLPFKICTEPEELDDSTKILLPGVGAFDHTVERLENSGLRKKLDELVAAGEVSILGICVGMQILGRSSEEGTRAGLGWIDGVVRKLDSPDPSAATRLPHMGWNDVKEVGTSALFKGLDSEPRFYFLHSYYFECDRAEEEIATTEYVKNFACAIKKGKIYGVQFHPEKSHRYGVQLLKNFAEL
jgi:glutamine amidotransferase